MIVPTRTLPTILAVLTTLLMAGCGVQLEKSPDLVPTAEAPSTTATTGNDPAGSQLIVYFVRGAELTPVQRRADSATATTAMALLVEGPTRPEAAGGLRTALPPEVVGVELDLADGFATVAVSRGFAGITGGNQLLAVAQVVWTLTESPQVSAVRFAVDKTPVEVPTDSGLTERAVTRGDYLSVRPIEPEASESPVANEPATPTSSPATR
jgi:Sporulation and spore germination